MLWRPFAVTARCVVFGWLCAACCVAILGVVRAMILYLDVMPLPLSIPLDCHTHRLPAVAGQALVSIRPTEFCPQAGHYYSVGVHPWYPQDGESNWREMLRHPQVRAVGEAGLDKRCNTPWQKQLALFREQIEVSEMLGKPLIIHLVGATDELLALRRTLQPRQAWVIHGFRGKAPLAESYLRHGLYLSFGSRFQPEALLAVPLDRLLLETDESTEPIGEIYDRVARLRGISAATLTAATQANFGRICEMQSAAFAK